MADPKWMEEDKAFAEFLFRDGVQGRVKGVVERAHAHIAELRERICRRCREDIDFDGCAAFEKCMLLRETPPEIT